jgi:hypothetical protein
MELIHPAKLVEVIIKREIEKEEMKTIKSDAKMTYNSR